jgi:hypothetical protein
VNEWSEEEIARILWEYGDERRSRFIAKMIVDGRPIRTTGALATVVRRSLPPGPQKEKYKCLSRVFQVGGECMYVVILYTCRLCFVILYFWFIFDFYKKKKEKIIIINVTCYFILFYLYIYPYTHLKTRAGPADRCE